MDENVKKNYEYWCTSPIFDDATKSELKSLEGNEDEIFDRFYRELEFGTGGLRGVIGAGTNRMNFYTVGKATQGLANFINKQGAAAKGVAIAFANSLTYQKSFSVLFRRSLFAILQLHRRSEGICPPPHGAE